MITKDKKVETVSEITEGLSHAKSAAFVQFNGLDVATSNNLRKTLREQGIEYRVAKKTLIALAAKNAGLGEMEELPGNVAVAWSTTDETASAREIFEFAKGTKDKLTLVGGVFAGKLVDKEGITAIATIPGMQTLRGMFVNLINSPRARFAVVLSKQAEKNQ